ncbi:MAG: aspartyl protease family protein [Candidatus Omnitrophota bacterium]
MIEFDYKGFVKTDESGKILGVYYRPNAIVKLVNGDNYIVSNMLIDSGADVSVIPKAEGEALGFRIEKDEKIEDVNGIGGQIPVVHRAIEFNIGIAGIKINIAWALINDLPPIMGREGVFDTFIIEFRQKEKKVRFHRIK